MHGVARIEQFADLGRDSALVAWMDSIRPERLRLQGVLNRIAKKIKYRSTDLGQAEIANSLAGAENAITLVGSNDGFTCLH